MSANPMKIQSKAAMRLTKRTQGCKFCGDRIAIFNASRHIRLYAKLQEVRL